MSESSLMHTLELADQVIRQQRRDLLACGGHIRWCEQRITKLEAQVAQADGHRGEAGRRGADLEREVAEGRAREAALEERCRELEDRAQALEAEPVVTTSGVFGDDDAVEAFEFLDDEQQEALRYRIRCEQAVRARLAKTDMSPSARLRTLKQAKRLGLLDRRLREELRELREAAGDPTCSPAGRGRLWAGAPLGGRRHLLRGLHLPRDR